MYARTHRRVVRRMGSRSTGSQWLWCDASFTSTLGPGATAPVVTALDNGLNTQYSATRSGAVVQRIVGDITVVPTVVPAGTSEDAVVVGWLMQNASLPTASLDPTTGTGLSAKWLHQENWHQPYLAPVVTAGQVIEARRHVDIRVKRKYRDNEDNLILVAQHTGGAGNTQVWLVQWHFRILIRVP